VPGPQHPLYLAGARIEGQYFWVPQAGSIGVGVSILTYDGNVYFGLMTDGKVIAAPRAVVRLFAAEFEKLLLCTIAGATDEPFALANEASASPARQRTRTSRTSPSGSRKRAARPAT